MQALNGLLSVVSTPLGNLQDFSPRAIETLRAAELVLVEDTRSFSTLARRFDIPTPTKSYFEHNERQRAEEVLQLLKAGAQIALVSEAGTPAISDPGYRLIRACRQNGISVTGVPGPNAAILALSISGLPSDSFLFRGFLPQRPGRRQSTIESLMAMDCTSIIYESPHRIIKTLKAIADISKSREVFVGRELTKLHEECVWGTAERVLHHFTAKDSIKGEIVLLISGNQAEGAEDEGSSGSSQDDGESELQGT